ncbi:MAG TPA: hypothetical protein VEW03_00540 [Longimicrobiaceae bacterium]|nr:hypothetical protein [Longimicrobiaceae bacterium]
MTTPDTALPAVEDLQFDSPERAEASGPRAVACSACGAPITDVYHVVDAAVVCTACRRAAEQKAGARGLSRLPLAALYGVGAALLGVLVYVAVIVITGRPFGLIAILLGWMVGKAVSRGSGGQGGPAYQALAVGLTYLAVLGMYIPSGLPEGVGLLSLLLLPFTGGLGIIGLLILGFAVFEAWRLNSPQPMTITGPYQVGAAAPAGAEGAVV